MSPWRRPAVPVTPGTVKALWMLGRVVDRVRSCFQRRLPLLFRYVCLQVCGARICVPHHALHHVAALAVLGE